jgi:hypothetical protein
LKGNYKTRWHCAKFGTVSARTKYVEAGMLNMVLPMKPQIMI